MANTHGMVFDNVEFKVNFPFCGAKDTELSEWY